MNIMTFRFSVFGIWVLSLLIVVVCFLSTMVYHQMRFGEVQESLESVAALIIPQVTIMSACFFGASEARQRRILNRDRGIALSCLLLEARQQALHEPHAGFLGETQHFVFDLLQRPGHVVSILLTRAGVPLPRWSLTSPGPAWKSRTTLRCFASRRLRLSKHRTGMRARRAGLGRICGRRGQLGQTGAKDTDQQRGGRSRVRSPAPAAPCRFSPAPRHRGFAGSGAPETADGGVRLGPLPAPFLSGLLPPLATPHWHHAGCPRVKVGEAAERSEGNLDAGHPGVGRLVERGGREGRWRRMLWQRTALPGEVARVPPHREKPCTMGTRRSR